MNIYTYDEYMKLMETYTANYSSSGNVPAEAFAEFTKLNFQRMKRWNRKELLTTEIKSLLYAVQTDQSWIVITESWCGDAAHILPALNQMANSSGHIDLQIVFRDENPKLMDNYLYHGTKSIPVVISRNADGQDLFVWGPRPRHAQEIMENAKAGKFDSVIAKTLIQKWYNEDKAKETIKELGFQLELAEEH